MKLLITPYIDRFSGQGQKSAPVSLEKLITTNKTVLEWKNYQTIELQDKQLLRSQIDSVLDNLDINTILDPNMPNTGGIEGYCSDQT